MKINRHNFRTVEGVKDGFVLTVVTAEGTPVDISSVQMHGACRVGETIVPFEEKRFEETDRVGFMWPQFAEGGEYAYDVFAYDGSTEVVLLTGYILCESRVSPDFEGDTGGFSEVVKGTLQGTQIVKIVSSAVQVCSPTVPEIGVNGNWWIDGVDTGRPSNAPIELVTNMYEQHAAAGLSDNYTLHGFVMTAQYTGHLIQLSLEARDNRTITDTAPKWLRVWACHGNDRTLLGTSKTAVSQVIGTVSVWPFEDVTITKGQELAITAHNEMGEEYSNFARLDCRVLVNTAEDGGVIVGADGIRTDANWMANYAATFEVQEGISIGGVAIARSEDLHSHATDMQVHVTNEDRNRWDSKANEDALTAHASDSVSHVTNEERQRWDNGGIGDIIKIQGIEFFTPVGNVAKELKVSCVELSRGGQMLNIGPMRLWSDVVEIHQPLEVGYIGPPESQFAGGQVSTKSLVDHINKGDDLHVPEGSVGFLKRIDDQSTEGGGTRVMLNTGEIIIGTDETAGRCEVGCSDSCARIAANALSVAVMASENGITLRVNDYNLLLDETKLRVLDALLSSSSN